MSEPEVLVEVAGPVAKIVLNRPAKLNALNVDLVASLEQAAGQVAGEEEVRVVIVAGRGRSFCSGLDLDMFVETGMSPAFFERQEGAFRLLETMDKITVAAIQGHCLGGGVQLAAACDVRVASSSAQLGLPAVNEGLFPGMAPFRLPRLIGKGRAMSLILGGQPVTAEVAHQIGLVDVVAADDDFDAEVTRLADTYAAIPHAAAVGSKRLMALSYEATFDEALEQCRSLLDECLRSPEVAAIRARGRKGATNR